MAKKKLVVAPKIVPPKKTTPNGATEIPEEPEILHAYITEDKKQLDLLLQYSSESLREKDADGYTILHYAAHNNDKAVVDSCLEHCRSAYNDYVRMQATDGRTAADVALAAKHGNMAHMLFARELYTSPLHLQIKHYYEEQQKQLSEANKQQAKNYRSLLSKEINRLFESQHIVLTDEQKEIIGPKRSAELESYTVLGKVESDIRSMIKRRLKSEVEQEMREVERRVDIENERRWEEFHEETESFDIDNCEWDYDGPIEPEEPTNVFFDPNEYGDLDDLANLIEQTEIESYDLGQLAYDNFITLDALDDIREAIDCKKLNISPRVINYVFSRLDVQFDNPDVVENGFLVEAIQEEIEKVFDELFYDFGIDDQVQEAFTALVSNPKSRKMAHAYNQAASEQDMRGLQQNWMRITPLLVNLARLPNVLKTKAYKESDEKIYGAACKIYPNNKTDKIVYAAKWKRKEASQPLAPLFETLSKIGQEVKAAVDKEAGDNTTNVITAMLSLVVSAEPHVSKAESGERNGHKRIFVNIPLVFHYPGHVLSKDLKDGVFASQDDFYRSVGEDQQQGGTILGLPCDTEGLEPRKQEAFAAAIRISETVKGLTKGEAGQLHALLTKAKGLPLSEDGQHIAEFELKSEVAKTTENNHSERVLFHALKQPENIAQIVEVLSGELRKALGVNALKTTEEEKYKVYSAALVMASTPNTVCRECSRGVIALQNSYEKGFLKLLIDGLNHSEHFKTRGYDQIQETQDKTKFGVTTVVVAEKAFDPQAKAIEKQPESKLHMKFDPKYHLRNHIIDMRFAEKIEPKRNTFYEYVQKPAKKTSPTVPYEGQAYMSGSIESKKMNRAGLNNTVKEIIARGKGAKPSRIIILE